MKRKTQEEFVKEVFNKLGEDYTVLGKYKTSRDKIEMQHEKCGFKYMTTRDIIIDGGRCPNCFGTPKKTTEQFSKEVLELTNGEYELIGEYKTNKITTKLKHIECGNEFNLRPDSFVNGQRCPKCRYTKARKTNDVFMEEVYKLVGDEYTLIEEYTTHNTKIKIQHNDCGYKYKVKPNDFLNGRRCPKCRDSKGEKEIARILDSFELIYKRQYIIDECKHVNPLPFDFGVLDENGNLMFLVEFQGEQHYKPINIFGGEERFKLQIKRDEIKLSYCKNNNIKLICIPYYDFNKIEDILKATRKNV